MTEREVYQIAIMACLMRANEFKAKADAIPTEDSSEEMNAQRKLLRNQQEEHAEAAIRLEGLQP